jgi:hypothetical protein
MPTPTIEELDDAFKLVMQKHMRVLTAALSGDVAKSNLEHTLMKNAVTMYNDLVDRAPLDTVVTHRHSVAA